MRGPSGSQGRLRGWTLEEWALEGCARARRGLGALRRSIDQRLDWSVEEAPPSRAPKPLLPLPAHGPEVDDRILFDVQLAPFVRPSVTLALELGLLERLLETPMTIEATARAAGISSRSAEALLAVCAALGLLARDAEGRLHASATTLTYLGSGLPWARGPLVREASPIVAALRLAISTDAPSVPLASEMGELADARRDEFVRLMHLRSSAAACALAEHEIFAGFDRLLDVAGGGGTVSAALTARHRALRCTVLELPAVARVGRACLRELGADRVTMAEGDMFRESWPSAHDAVLFCNVFHDWPPDTCATLAARAYACLPRGGSVLLYEAPLDETRDGPLAVALMSISMLLHERGKQYTLGELEATLRAAGFVDVESDHGFGYFRLVRARKP